MTPPAPPKRFFEETARRVARRLLLHRLTDRLTRTAPWLTAAAIAVALGAILLGERPTLWILALGTGWLVAVAGWSWWQRPDAQKALAVWDQTSNRREMFVSAYCFEKEPHTDAGRQLHIHRAQNHLDRATGNLEKDLPVRLGLPVWAALAVLLTGALLPGFGSISGPDPMDPDARQRARKVANDLTDRSDTLEKLKK
ncbi:MAG: hypothetical protein R3236_01355, partial [Phycisphaeraceae bacterium]|nr:hypothetical protein [Phycisphaeraceae bacterium]